ncbi:MAG: nucleoside-diphosphate kinase [Herpetosiphonaceae bacterium]|nr:nucleoside-diphosphate kinase [Herpetosiphonaceae bacterium]
MERSLVILKPDALQRGLLGTLIGRLEARGLKFVGLKLMQIDDTLARKHYEIHKDRPFFPSLVQFIQSGPVVVIAIEGQDVIETIRSTVGATNPVKATPGTIRGDFAVSIGRNLIHASDTLANGQTEVNNFFESNELLGSYQRDTDKWIFEA